MASASPDRRFGGQNKSSSEAKFLIHSFKTGSNSSKNRSETFISCPVIFWIGIQKCYAHNCLGVSYLDRAFATTASVRLESEERLTIGRKSDIALDETARVRRIEQTRVELAHHLAGIFDKDLELETDRLLGRGFHRNTLRAYKNEFGEFRAWCASEKLPSLPTVPEVIAYFVVVNAGRSIKPSVFAIVARVDAIADRLEHLSRLRVLPSQGNPRGNRDTYRRQSEAAETAFGLG
jgi:hypothetical protein